MNQFIVALKFSLKEQVANRFAFGLLIIFVPIWYWVLGLITPNDLVPFKFGPTGALLQANGHQMVLISAGLNVLALIVGFMFFHSAHRSISFDRRLTRAGLNQAIFILAKGAALLVVTALVALYTLLILLIFWHFPNNIAEVWLGYWAVALIYGSFGLLLGVLLNSELAGFFIIIMVSMMDVFLQVPIDNPAANNAFLGYLPSYSTMQLGVAGGFTHIFAQQELLPALSWFLGFLLLAFIIFYLRTRTKVTLQEATKD